MAENYLNILAETIRNNWEQPALTDFYLTEDGTAQDTSRGNHYTYGEMYEELCRVAELLTSLGLQKGDHVAICGANSAHWTIAYLAIAKMQGVSVTVMHSLMPEEIARLIDFSDAKALFTDEDIWEELKSQPMPQVGNVIGLENWQILRGENLPISNFQSPISNSDCGFPQSAPDELAMICFTSGTSGSAKGVMLSYGNISNNVNDFHNLHPKSSNNMYLSLCPFAHLSGFIGDLMSQITLHKNIHIPGNVMHTKGIYSAMLCVKPYMYISVPQVFKSLYEKYKEQIFEDIKSFCNLIFVGGAAIERKTEQCVQNSPIPLAIVYGQTETGASIAISPYKKHRLTSCGKIVEGITCRISPAGEILVKGENVMLGYYKDPEATAAKIDSDGWLHTGDKGHLDEDGYLYVEGRLEQDIIVLPNGENIRPDNIESLINALPEVKESIVLARKGNLVAIVVPQITNHQSPITNTDLRRIILRNVNPSLPLFSQLYDVEISDTPLQRTEKQTIKRYLYK